MSVFIEVIIPSIIITVANIFSYEPNTKRYKYITALFGWSGGILLFISILLQILLFLLSVIENIQWATLISLSQILFQFGILCVVSAMSREYEAYLKAKARVIENKIKTFLRR